jgi:hypothetical protein
MGRIIGPKKGEVTGDCRKVHKEIHHLYITKHFWDDQIKMRLKAHVGQVRNACKVLVGKPERKTCKTWT